MVKVIVLLPRRADRDQEEFRRCLNEKHLPLVRRLVPLERLGAHPRVSGQGPHRRVTAPGHQHRRPSAV
jgi:hypothetical protein